MGGLSPALRRADLAVNLHGRGPRSTAVLAATRPRTLVAFDRPGGPRWDDDEHEVQRWCRLLASAGVPADPDDLGLAPPGVAAPVAGATVVHPGASAPSRRWPVERWAALARHLAGTGHRVVVTGTAEEAARCAAVVAGAGLESAGGSAPSCGPDLAGRLALPALAALVAGARLVVSGDTGVAHLASGYATPSVVLFGPVAPSRWGPPRHPRHQVLWTGSTGDPHGVDVDPGLRAIAVSDVIEAVDRLAVTGYR